MEAWPAYAKIKFENFAENRDSGLMRTDMETGPAKQVRIKSLVMVTRPVKIRLESLVNYQAFVVWFSTNINEGADWFNWTDPVSGAVKIARFAEGGLKAQPLAGTLGYWEISQSLETWG